MKDQTAAGSHAGSSGSSFIEEGAAVVKNSISHHAHGRIRHTGSATQGKVPARSGKSALSL